MKKKLELPDVTLLAATSVEINETQLSLRISAQNIKFGNIKFLSSSIVIPGPTRETLHVQLKFRV